MKKLLPVVFIGILVVGGWYFISSSRENVDPTASPAAETSAQAGETANGNSGTVQTSVPSSVTSGDVKPTNAGAQDDDDYDMYEDVTPATELYKSADEALEAVRKGAGDYDDLILEQFVELGDDCSWCPTFYKNLTDMMLNPAASEDEKSYYAEVLAISGRVENVKTLVTAIEDSKDEDTADIFAEALEVTIGDNDTVHFLGEKLNTQNELLQESVLAAITNHGSREAIDLLYKHTVEKGDPDGYYSLGIGLGEVIPEEESVPYLTELVNKRDQFSHLALKGLLNYGTEGLRIVIDVLSNSNDPDFDRQMLEDAIDHVNYEDETEELLLRTVKTSNSPVAREFAKAALEDFDIEADDYDYDDDEEDATNDQP